jgi:hypothetical protein
MKVDLGQACLAGELLEPAGDRVRVRRLAVLPAEQHAVVLVVRPEVLALLVEHLDVCLEYGECERVERQRVLCVLGLAVRLDHLAVDDYPRGFDFERSGVEVEQVAACARQLAAAHARCCFEDPQREEPVVARALQESL